MPKYLISFLNKLHLEGFNFKLAALNLLKTALSLWTCSSGVCLAEDNYVIQIDSAPIKVQLTQGRIPSTFERLLAHWWDQRTCVHIPKSLKDPL